MRISLLDRLAHRYGTPLYVYDAETIRKRFFLMQNAIPYHKKRIYYAAKANSNVHILRLLRKCGAYADTFSPGEVFLSLKAGFPPSHVIFSGNNASEEDLRYVSQRRVTVSMDSLSQIGRYAKMKSRGEIFLRVNTLVGAGHHKRVVTGGRESKFGIHVSLMKEARGLCKKYGLKIVGLHSHIGSGIMNRKIFLKNASILLSLAEDFPDIKFVDCGGGFGISYSGEEKFDMAGFGKRLSGMVERWVEKHGKEITLCVEPGRFLLAESGFLVCRVTTIKRNPDKTFIGVDSGFNHFMRHLLYDSRHRMEAYPKRKEIETADMCGNLCESGDVFVHNAKMGKREEGDLIVIKDAGAYGFSMASHYNARLLPAEILWDKGKSFLIRKRETFYDLI